MVLSAPVDAPLGADKAYLRGVGGEAALAYLSADEPRRPGIHLDFSEPADEKEYIEQCTDSQNVESFQILLAQSLGDFDPPEFGSPPRLVWLVGGMAQGKTKVQKEIERQTGLNEGDVVHVDGDSLLHRIPEVSHALKVMKQSAARNVIEGCRGVTKQVQWPFVKSVVENELNMYYESTTDRLMTKINDGKVPTALSEKYAISFGVTIVEDLESIVRAAAERGKRTGQLVPEDRVRLKARGNELLYLKIMETLITKGIGVERRFFVQCRCTAFSPTNVVEVTEERIRAQMGPGRSPGTPEQARSTICGKLVPKPCDAGGERAYEERLMGTGDVVLLALLGAMVVAFILMFVVSQRANARELQTQHPVAPGLQLVSR